MLLGKVFSRTIRCFLKEPLLFLLVCLPYSISFFAFLGMLRWHIVLEGKRLAYAFQLIESEADGLPFPQEITFPTSSKVLLISLGCSVIYIICWAFSRGAITYIASKLHRGDKVDILETCSYTFKRFLPLVLCCSCYFIIFCFPLFFWFTRREVLLTAIVSFAVYCLLSPFFVQTFSRLVLEEKNNTTGSKGLSEKATPKYKRLFLNNVFYMILFILGASLVFGGYYALFLFYRIFTLLGLAASLCFVWCIIYIFLGNSETIIYYDSQEVNKGKST